MILLRRNSYNTTKYTRGSKPQHMDNTYYKFRKDYQRLLLIYVFYNAQIGAK
jgi:hypothetical protein